MDKKSGEIGPDGNRKIDDDVGQDEIRNVSVRGANYEQIYERGTGLHRYSNALKNLIPVRRKGRETHIMAVDSAGFFSGVCFTWISKIMYKAYGEGITMEELPTLSPYDGGNYNAKRCLSLILVLAVAISLISCTNISQSLLPNNLILIMSPAPCVDSRLELLWNDELAKWGPKDASLLRVAWRFCRTRIFAVCLIFTGNLISSFLSYTFLMRKLLEYVQSGNGSYEEGAKWVLLLTAAELSRILFMSWTWAFNTRSAVRLRSACLTLLYGKIIRVDNLGNQNIGKVINMFVNDSQAIYEMILIGPMIVGAPIATIFGVFYILWLLGPMALLGMIAFLLFFPLQYMMSRLTGYFQTKTVKISDMRIKLMNEILDCIKLIKMYAWEKRFSKDLLGLRRTENRLLLKAFYCRSFCNSMAPAIPVLSAIITFLAHVSVGNDLTASQAFPYSTFLHSGLSLLLIFFQLGIAYIISAGISLKRMKSLLLLEDGNCLSLKPNRESQALEISHGIFGYNTFGDYNKERSQVDDKERTISADKSEQQMLNQPTDNADHVDVLFDISFEVGKGKLVGICGHVGSGKSSLLLAALGQLRVSEGQVMRDGSCAYVSQQAWITNATLRENILFGAKFDKTLYHKTIYACNLSQDIDMMPGGDQTEIGEKGVNLSGGQKQRIALARALYADRDIYFLDDPLSAVDSRVGAFIFNNLILRALREKTVLFVTHQIQYLNRCDDIYMMGDGRIIEHGTHDELVKLGNQYALMVTSISIGNETENETIVDQATEAFAQSFANIPLHEADRNRADSISSQVSKESVKNSNIHDAQLTVDENLQQGSIKAHTYHSYITAAGGYFSVLLVILTFIATAASISFSSWWLAFWIKAGGGNKIIVRNNETIPSDNLNDNPDFWYYQSIYAGTIGIIILTSALRSLVYTKVTIGASTKLHNDLFKKLIASPTRFFDTTPSGRIQQLFSADMGDVDNRLPTSVADLIQNVITISFATLAICLVFPWLILPMCILAIFYYYISKIFRVAIRDLKRIDNKARAPIISFVTATVQGLSTIHAFGKEKDFMMKFTELFDANSKCMMLCFAAMRWLAVRIDGFAVAITGTTAFLVVALQGQVPPALAGLALSYSVHISDGFQYTIRLLSETEVRFISVERINHYIRTLESEGSTNQSLVEPPSSWPAAAEIKFIGVSMAYGDGTPFVLKNVSFTIRAGEKIGIVGRTGSGKSSLTVALFRLVELAKGNIEIDNIDISKISLDQLRTKLAIIPQDPVLFSGTIRSNLDPFKLYTDAEIWKALEKTELKGKVQSMTGQLDASVGFGGDKMSVGERQLLCLSRALLRNSKILVLDEATATVDPETEIVVQNTINQEFSHCTVLSIAHRLKTVLSLNRILVMDNGRVLEFDTPSNLLRDLCSEFSKIIAAAEQSKIQ